MIGIWKKLDCVEARKQAFIIILGVHHYLTFLIILIPTFYKAFIASILYTLQYRGYKGFIKSWDQNDENFFFALI